MKTTDPAREDFQQDWMALPWAFRATHTPPDGRDHEHIAAWLNAVHKDCEGAAVAILDASIAYLARGETDAARTTAEQARPFRRVMRTLDALARPMLQEPDGDPLHNPCDECGAEAGHECRPTCTAQD